MLETARRTQKDRSDTTRALLLQSGRALFVRQGFAGTSTPEIVASAGVTRGALYHHFADKIALFDALIAAEAKAVAASVHAAEFGGMSAIETLVQGGEAWLAAMRFPGRTRLLLVEAPVVLPAERLTEMASATGPQGLAEALAAAGVRETGPLAELLRAAYKCAALAIDAGAPPGQWRTALERLVRSALR